LGHRKKKKTFGILKFNVKFGALNAKKKLLKSNDFILVAIFMAPNFGAQSEKK